MALGTLSGAELDAPPAGAFTIVVVPDTQAYRGANTRATPDSQERLTNEVFANHIRWIREQREAQRIVFVSHVGDIVDRNKEDQWALARELLDGLRGVVPFGLAVGNHDMTARGDAALFRQHFPAAGFREFSWYGGTLPGRPGREAAYGDNVNSYQLFSAGGLDFIFLHLECNAPDEVVAWADQVLQQYRDRRALISTHMDLGILEKPKTEDGFVSDPKGRMRWSKIHGVKGNSPQQLWDKLYRRHANLGFIFSGDQSRVTALYQQDRGEHGNVVHALLSDYMSAGPLRLYRFIPAQNEVQVITYDTTRRTLVDRMVFAPARTSHQFTLGYRMEARVAH